MAENDEYPTFRITNEFAQVEIRKVKTGKGERLEIYDRENGDSIRLDALELESLTWQDNERFDELFEAEHQSEQP